MAETHLVNPVVRKAVGAVYHEQKKYAAGATQLQLAAEAQPSDLETQKLLLDCYDNLGQKEPAIARVLQNLQTARRDIEQYRDLGRRYTGLGRAKEAERAYTSLVEVLPNEAEGHALLAEVRQEQDRWNEALAHWQQVVRIRVLEPEGWLELAAAQIHQRQWDQASATLEHLNSRSWPARFQDVPKRIQTLKESFAKKRKEANN
jgi:tetratricopeptide (TPR) repeat protein